LTGSEHDRRTLYRFSTAPRRVRNSINQLQDQASNSTATRHAASCARMVVGAPWASS